MGKIHIPKRLLSAIVLIALAGGVLGFLGVKSGVLLTENQKFENFTDNLFVEEVRANTLNLHYTLAYPKEFGIKDYPISLGSIKAEDIPASYAALENYQDALHSFSYRRLSDENQMTYDILDLDIQTQLSLGEQYMMMEPLSPSLGIQAQLPVLLAEYTFRKEQDIKDYLALLQSIPRYFEEIAVFESQKSEQGLFMSDTTADRVIAQCQAFISQVSSDGTSDSSALETSASSSGNYLSTMFSEKLKGFKKKLSEAKISSYITSHEKILNEQVIPAYTNLINSLNALKGTGKNTNGLTYLPQGTAYYQYLVQSGTGDFNSLDTIEKRLYKQLLNDYEQMQQILKNDPSLISELTASDGIQAEVDAADKSIPPKILESLQTDILDDFPKPVDAEYEIKYVHPSLEEFLSPAFYLTPPIDTLSPNVIYINNGSTSSYVDLFTTLAHEGFPGHLYQTLYFSQSSPSKIRYLLSYGGYVEGWATYIESYAYNYVNDNENLTRFLWLNRSINLCLYSIMDMGIHYHGWTPEMVTKYLASFGISDTAVCQEIFQYIVENPANYLKYYMGYLNFADLRDKVKEKQGENFDLKAFHQNVLELGPCQFPVLEKYIVPD